MKVHLTDHAVARYAERVKPTLSLPACRRELVALVKLAGEPVPDPPDSSDAYLQIAPGIVAPLVRNQRDWIVKTVLTNSGYSDQGRARISAAKARRRRNRRWARRNASRHVEPFVRTPIEEESTRA